MEQTTARPGDAPDGPDERSDERPDPLTLRGPMELTLDDLGDGLG